MAKEENIQNMREPIVVKEKKSVIKTLSKKVIDKTKEKHDAEDISDLDAGKVFVLDCGSAYCKVLSTVAGVSTVYIAVVAPEALPILAAAKAFHGFTSDLLNKKADEIAAVKKTNLTEDEVKGLVAKFTDIFSSIKALDNPSVQKSM